MNTEEMKAMLSALDGVLAPLFEAAVSLEGLDVKITLEGETSFEASYDPEDEQWKMTVR